MLSIEKVPKFLEVSQTFFDIQIAGISDRKKGMYYYIALPL